MVTLSTGFWFWVCYAATQLALQLHQDHIQVVRSNRVARKHPAESNGTPAMDLGHMNVVSKWCICSGAGLRNCNCYYYYCYSYSYYYVFGVIFFPVSSYLSFFLLFVGVHEMCIWAEMHVLWVRCSMLCRIYERGKDLVSGENNRTTVASREIETTVFDPASQFLSNISRRV